MTNPTKKQKIRSNKIIKFDPDRFKSRRCDHQWCFVSINELKNKIEWKCNYCDDVGVTNDFPKGEWENKFVGFKKG